MSRFTTTNMQGDVTRTQTLSLQIELSRQSRAGGQSVAMVTEAGAGLRDQGLRAGAVPTPTPHGDMMLSWTQQMGTNSRPSPPVHVTALIPHGAPRNTVALMSTSPLTNPMQSLGMPAATPSQSRGLIAETGGEVVQAVHLPARGPIAMRQATLMGHHAQSTAASAALGAHNTTVGGDFNLSPGQTAPAVPAGFHTHRAAGATHASGGNLDGIHTTHAGYRTSTSSNNLSDHHFRVHAEP